MSERLHLEEAARLIGVKARRLWCDALFNYVPAQKAEDGAYLFRRDLVEKYGAVLRSSGRAPRPTTLAEFKKAGVDRSLTREQAAFLLGVPKDEVDRLIKNGRLKTRSASRFVSRPTTGTLAEYEDRYLRPFPTGEPAPRVPVVYVVGTSDHVKIGFSTDFRSRFQALKTGSPGTLGVLHTMPGTRALEKRLHRRFAAQWAGGEWFRREGAVADWIAAGCPV